MVESDSSELTALLVRWRDGDDAAFAMLAPIIYQELRSLARIYMSKERREHTLQPTALVHELFLRLFNDRTMNWRSRAHFFGVAAKLMRRLLVDHARKKQAAKRSGSVQLAGDFPFAAISSEDEVLAVDQALGRLEAFDARKAQVVECKYFAGMTNEETAVSLEISVSSVERDWAVAKAWLYRELKSQNGSGPLAS